MSGFQSSTGAGRDRGAMQGFTDAAVRRDHDCLAPLFTRWPRLKSPVRSKIDSCQVPGTSQQWRIHRGYTTRR